MEPWEDELLLDDDFSEEEEDAEEQIEKTSLEMDADALPIGRIPLTVRRRTRHWRKRLQRNARWSWKASWSRTSIPETIMPSWRTRKRKPHPPAKNGSSGKFVQRLCGGWRKQPGRNPIF